MTATWTAPKTWSNEELVTAALMNTHLRDNLEFLKSPPSAVYKTNEGSNYSTSSTSFVDVDATNLALTIVTAGGDVMVGFAGTVHISSTGSRAHFDVAMDGTRQAGDDGILFTGHEASQAERTFAFVYLITGVSADSHTFKLQWKVNTSTATLYAGAGTSGKDIHPQFWVREVS